MSNQKASTGVRYVTVEGTVWPVPDDVEWTLRYGTPEVREAQRMGVASIVGAYEYLTNPHLPMYVAVDALRRARKAQAAASPTPTEEDTP